MHILYLYCLDYDLVQVYLFQMCMTHILIMLFVPPHISHRISLLRASSTRSFLEYFLARSALRIFIRLVFILLCLPHSFTAFLESMMFALKGDVLEGCE